MTNVWKVLPAHTHVHAYFVIVIIVQILRSNLRGDKKKKKIGFLSAGESKMVPESFDVELQHTKCYTKKRVEVCC